MTSSEIEAVTRDVDAAWYGPNGEPLLNPNMPTDVANYRATLEVAYQLAFLNEQICEVIQTREPRIRVMVEPGEWPIQIKEQRR